MIEPGMAGVVVVCSVCGDLLDSNRILRRADFDNERMVLSGWCYRCDRRTPGREEEFRTPPDPEGQP
jgi:hypothetical protein